MRRQIADTFKCELDEVRKSYIVSPALAYQSGDILLMFECVSRRDQTADAMAEHEYGQAGILRPGETSDRIHVVHPVRKFLDKKSLALRLPSALVVKSICGKTVRRELLSGPF